MEEVTLTLSLNEINTILNGLGNMPFIQVHELILKIQQQAQNQLSGGGKERE